MTGPYVVWQDEHGRVTAAPCARLGLTLPRNGAEGYCRRVLEDRLGRGNVRCVRLYGHKAS